MEIICRPDAKMQSLNMGERNTAIFLDFVRKNPNVPWRLTPVLPESGKQRRYLEGCILPLITFYQDGLDHKKTDDVRKVRDWMKLEFNSEALVMSDTVHMVAKSTKGRDALQPFLERVVGWLVDNYAPPQEALDPEFFKEWRDTIFPVGGPDNYIDYLKAQGIIS
jgi:hypothetical protein